MVVVVSLSERIAGQHDVTFCFSKIQNGGWSFRGRDDVSLKFAHGYSGPVFSHVCY